MTIPAKALCRIAPVLAAVLAPVIVSPAMAAAPAKAPVPSAQALPMPFNPVVSANQRLCSVAGPSGLGAMTLKAAEGPKPAKADYVLVNYIGYLAANGEVFDQNTQSAFPVEGVIPGFSEGLQMMAKGSVWRFCVPAALGYGAEVSGPIPANSDLVFQVELVDFKTTAEIEAMQAAAGGASTGEAAPAGTTPKGAQ